MRKIVFSLEPRRCVPFRRDIACYGPLDGRITASNAIPRSTSLINVCGGVVRLVVGCDLVVGYDLVVTYLLAVTSGCLTTVVVDAVALRVGIIALGIAVVGKSVHVARHGLRKADGGWGGGRVRKYNAVWIVRAGHASARYLPSRAAGLEIRLP